MTSEISSFVEMTVKKIKQIGNKSVFNLQIGIIQGIFRERK
jgi:hypothetical protein